MSVHWLSRLLLPFPGVEKLALHMPELRRARGQIALPIVWQVFLASGVMACVWADARGYTAALVLQVALVVGCFVLVDVVGIHNRHRWLRLSPRHAYRVCFWALFTPGLIGGFVPGVVHIAIVPGERLVPLAVGGPIGVPMLLLGVLVAFRVYSSFSLDRLFYLYMFHPRRGEMASSGIFRFIRHPQYASFIYLFVGLVALRGSLESLSLVAPFALVLVGRIIPEERELCERFGQPYVQFRASTPKFIPRWGETRRFFTYLVTGDD